MGRITLYGFYQYDKSILDEIIVPEGMDREMLVAEIIKNSGELYPYHQQPDMLKLNVKNWFSRKLYDFTQMHKALTAEYNPIENYDRTETISRESKNSGSDTETTTLGSKTITETIGNSENLTGVSAYNASDFTNREKETANNSDTITNTGSGSDTAKTDYGMIRNETENAHIHGNIGVTTNQQMITEEMKLRVRYDLYKVIADMFEHEFLVQVY